MSGHAVRNARLKAAQSRWAREERKRGYTTYRNGRPYKRPVKAQNELLTWLFILACFVVSGWIMGLAF